MSTAGAFGVTTGLLERFGRARVRDTPISEIAIVGAGVGAALCGLRPGRRAAVLRLRDLRDGPDRQPGREDPLHARRRGAGAAGDPRARGLRDRGGGAALAEPGGRGSHTSPASRSSCRPRRPTPAGLLWAAVEDPNPVLVLEHKLLYKQKGDVPREHHVPLGKAAVRHRPGDLTIVATSVMAGKSLAAAEELGGRRRRRDRRRPPHDHPARRRHDPASRSPPPGRCCSSRRRRRRRGSSRRSPPGSPSPSPSTPSRPPIVRLCGLDAPMAYAPELEKASVPQIPDIVAAARRLANHPGD